MADAQPRRRRRGGNTDGGESSASTTSTTSASSSANKEYGYSADVDQQSLIKEEAELFVPEKAPQCFVKAKCISVTGSKVTVQIEETGDTVDFDKKDVYLRNPKKFDGALDMASLTFLSEPAVLENLRYRYDKNQIYTYSGLFLVAVNPYQNLPIYTEDVIKKHNGKRRQDVEPHVFTISDVAYRQMLTNQINQSMLVTGESGAGKTENTKRVIQYLTAIAGSNNEGGKLQQQLLQTNPLLEAFGNAKTKRNNNSSRFGKFIDIAFNASGFIAGTKIDHYLLETSRVVFQTQGERNFHFFYQICNNSDARAKYQLKTVDHYDYLNKSGALVVDGINDQAEYRDTIKSAKVIGFSEEEIDCIQAATAAILHLGNITFVEDEEEHSSIPNQEPLRIAAELLGANVAALEKGFIKPRMKAGLEVIDVPASAEQASNNRHSLVKSLYLRLFDWLVGRINQNLVSKEAIKNSIGVLDIAGFEIFENNSYEQLCINFTNEKLQQFFNNHMFKKEQEEYLREKIEWTQEDFGLDLQPTIDLIEKKGGIFDILDNNTFMSASTNQGFALAVIKTHSDKPVFGKDRFDDTKFNIKHYAATVTYTVDNWLEKNVDPLNEDCKIALNASNKQFFKTLFPIDPSAEAVRGGGARFSTIAGQYREQLTLLMNVLRATEPHFIRCIKPNDVQKPGIINNEQVLDQLRCNGVLEGIRISRKGYPGRIKFADFLRRYSLLGDKDVMAKTVDPKQKCKHILESNDFKNNVEFQLGSTKVFLRSGQEARLEEIRETKLQIVILVAQAAVKGGIERKRLGNMVKKISSAKLLQRNYRAYMQLKDWPWFQLFQRARPQIAQMKKDDAKLATLQEEIENLEDDLADELEKLNARENEKAKLREEVDRLKALLQDNASKQSNIQKQMENLNNELKNKETELQFIIGEKSSKDGELQHYNLQLEQLRKNLLTKEQEQKEIEEKMKENADTLKALSGDDSTKEQEIYKAKQKIKELEEEIKNVRLEIDQEHNEVQNVKQVQRNLEDRLRDTQAKLEVEAKARRDKEEKLNQLLNHQKQVQADLNNERGRNNSLDTDIGRARAEKEAADEELAEKSRLLDELTRQKKAVDAQIVDLNRRYDEEVRNKQAAETKNRHTGNEIAEAKYQIEGLVETQNQLEDEIANLQAQIDDLKVKINDIEEEIEKLEDKNENLEKQLQDIKFNLESEIKRAKEDLDRVNKRYDDAVREFKDQLEQLSAANDNLDKKYRKADGEFKKLKRQYEDAQREKEDADSKLAKLENEVLNGGTDVDSLRRDVAKLENQKREVDSLKKDLEVQVTAEKEELSRQTLKKNQTKRDVDDAKERADSLEEEKQGLEQVKANDENIIKDLEQQVNAEKDANNKLKSEVNFTQKTMDDLQNKYNQLNEEKNRVENSKRGNDSQVTDIANALESEAAAKANLERKKKNLESELRKLKEELASAQSKVRDEVNAAQTVEQILRESEVELASQKNQNGEVQRQIRSLQTELENVKAKLGEVEANQRKLKDDKNSLEKNADALDERRDELNEQMQSVQSLLQNVRSKLQQQQNKNQSESSVKAQLDQDNSRLQSEIQKSKDDKNTENVQLKNQLDALKSQLAQHDNETSREIKKLSEERKELKSEVKQLQREIANKPSDGIDTEAYDKLKRDFELELAKLKAKLDEEMTARNNAEARKRAIEYQIAETKDLLNHEERIRKKVETQKKALSMEADELRELAEESEDLREEINSLKSKSEEVLSTLRGELESERALRLNADEQEQRAKRESETLKMDLEQEKQKLLDASRRIEQQYESEIAELNSLLNKAKRDKTNVSASSKRVDRELRDLNRRAQQEAVEKSDVLNKLAQAERDMKLIKSKFDQDTFEMEKSEQEKSRIDQSIQREQERISSLEDELSKLKTQIANERKRSTQLKRNLNSINRYDD